MKIDVLTLFPEIVNPYMDAAMMQRARDAEALSFGAHNIRDFSQDTHQNVDATPYGGGAGMVMQVEPIHRAHESVTSDAAHTILLSAKGKMFTQRDAERLSAHEHLIFICGRYEGVDERVAEHIADEEFSIGSYVLTGGELGAMVITDSVVRLLPGVLGNDDSTVHESYSRENYKEHPHYTKPDLYNGWGVPEVLTSGNHAAIEKWRDENATEEVRIEREDLRDERGKEESQE